MVQRRRRLLDVDTILDAALACVDETGRLTMAELAARLGTSASAVYKHLSGRGAIVEALRERVVVEGLWVPPLDGTDWAAQLAAWMRSYRDALARHPRLIPLLTETTMTGGPVLRGYDRVAALLRQAGVPAREVLLWISVLDSYALGAALDLAAPEAVWHDGDGALPALDEALRAAPGGPRRADEAFEIGLAALLTGLRHRLATRTGAGAGETMTA
ncbi:transcriptional regulator, TetR family [Geodermatophilus telluris]|uniref:Transcriptional regulator, TetR family n=1 Tax=Geodermatophilus telluris TaxID=1190417 RepID=A0A1G6TP72_9ACTN|nr:TetR/AcrR family transcriptional regulator C-terminal domain-containing protein [Geodermatophilus telluris]SDD30841.1 transcriptional regulator, TetR family [Geodermatophilus telluris]